MRVISVFSLFLAVTLFQTSAHAEGKCSRQDVNALQMAVDQAKAEPALFSEYEMMVLESSLLDLQKCAGVVTDRDFCSSMATKLNRMHQLIYETGTPVIGEIPNFTALTIRVRKACS